MTESAGHGVGIAIIVVVMTAVAWQGGCTDNPAPADHPVTFNKDIAPILFEHCAACHRPGESAPFSLMTYRDAVKRADQIADVTSKRFMPPWLPELGHGKFVGERRLDDAQIGLINQWAKQGAAEGNAADLPAAPRSDEHWQLGEPDLVLKMAQPYTLGADGADEYRNFVLPIRINGRRWVKAMEFRPGNRRIVHHANMKISPTGALRHLVDMDDEPGFSGMDLINGDIRFPDGHSLGWAPGGVPTPPHNDLAWRIDSDIDLVLLLHLLPSGKPEMVQSSVGLYYADRPPTRMPFIMRLFSRAIDIPAGQERFEVRDSYVLPVDVTLLSIYPHAHYLAKEMQGYAQLPDGSRRSLIWIRDWDFNWQQQYVCSEPIDLPKGTTLFMRFTYDNSAGNVRNPSDPPKRVTYGPDTFDEMCDLWLQVLPRNPRDLAILQQDFKVKFLETEATGYAFVLKNNPDDIVLNNHVGYCYLSLDRIDEAIARFEHTLSIDPNESSAHYYMGMALGGQGKTSDAIEHLRAALKTKPDDPILHYHLGEILLTDDPVEAVEHLRKAVRIRPNWDTAANNTAWVLAAHPNEQVRDAKQAVQLAEQAVRLTYREDPRAIDTLGVAHAAAGRFDQAIIAARAAMAITLAVRDTKLTEQIRKRLKLFEQHQPFIDSTWQAMPPER